ncbi:MAG TPA: TonB family protein [Rhodocyclaceae bacterium]|nr:TonB family protein [Rhodocyclaceae bacterium]
MPTSVTYRTRDGFERRLRWTVPGACLLGAGMLWLASLFLGHDTPLPPPTPEKPVDAQLIELPPSGVAHEHAPATPPAPPKDPLPVPRAVPATQQQRTPSVPQVAPAAPATPATPAPSTPAPTNVSSNAGNTGGARAIISPLPKIPDDLRDEAINMTVTARFHIAVDGSASVELIQPTPNPRLNRLVLETLQQWRFFPAVSENRPIASVQEIHIRIQ